MSVELPPCAQSCTVEVGPTCPSQPGRPSSGRTDLVADDRGAILVLGIFMCTCLAGMLWYLAGIGDAIVYRERMQEAADAGAFSGAVLLARGMNAIVFLNLIMACILAIRVALKVLLVICAVLAVVATIVSCFPWTSWLSPIATLLWDCVDIINNGIENTRDPINNATSALNSVEGALATAVPWAAIAGGIQVGEKYQPMVKAVLAGSPGSLQNGLPVEDDTTSMLCKKAGQATGWMIWNLLSLGTLQDSPWEGKFASFFGTIAEKGGTFFCETEGGSAPDFTEDINNNANSGCDDKQDGLYRDWSEKEAAYQSKCVEYNADCTGVSPQPKPVLPTPDGGVPEPTPSPEQLAELEGLNAASQEARYKAWTFNKEQCEQQAIADSRQNMQKANSSGGGSSGGGGGQSEVKPPKKVKDDWHNGHNDSQVLAASDGETRSLNTAPELVKVGAWINQYNFNTPATTQIALAQAEFFYDCPGVWTGQNQDGSGDQCKSAEPMWNFRWRARVRRYNSPFSDNQELMQRATAALLGVESLSQIVNGFTNLENLTVGNLRLRTDLARAIEDDAIIH